MSHFNPLNFLHLPQRFKLLVKICFVEKMQMDSQPEATIAQSVPSKSIQFTHVFGESRGRVGSLHTAAGTVPRSPRTSESLNLLCQDPSWHGPHTTSECISPAPLPLQGSVFEALGKSNANVLRFFHEHNIENNEDR